MFLKKIYRLIAIIIFMFLITIILMQRTKHIQIYTDETELLLINNVSTGMKHILVWTRPDFIPVNELDTGQKAFIMRNCSYTNCYVTNKKQFYSDIKKFDMILFHGPEIVQTRISLPRSRSPHQKFVFASIESSDYYPACENNWINGYFNWTWTYKLSSDAIWGYIIVKDKRGNIIGPKSEMHWLRHEEMKPVTKEFKEKLKTKTKAAVWFVSNCNAISRRNEFAKNLQTQLRKYNLTLDIYGQCGDLKCPLDNEDKCFNLIRHDYYFYLALENSFSEDYVTEKLLTALQNDAVPIVFGAANYSRFIPDGIYLNGKELGEEKTAEKMYELIQNNDKYADYFRWKNHYSYHDRNQSSESDICGFCAMLNNEKLVKETTVYYNFKKWWNVRGKCDKKKIRH